MNDDSATPLQEQKARLELRILKLDLFLKPVSLLTPIILAIAIFLLIQQPRQESEDRNQCLDELRFVESLDFEEANDALMAILEYPFTCKAARELFLGKVRLSELEAGIKSVGDEVETLVDEVRGLEDQQLRLPTGEVVAVPILVSSLEAIVEEIGLLSELKDAIDVQLVVATQRRDETLMGTDGTFAGRGPIFMEFERRIEEIEFQRRNVLEELRELEEKADEIQNLLGSVPGLPDFHCEQNPHLEGCQ